MNAQETVAVGHAFHQLYYHFAWSTRSRTGLIHRDHRSELLRIVKEEAKKRGGWPIRHNAMPDHVHLLVRLPPTVKISEFIGQVKGATSHRVNTLTTRRRIIAQESCRPCWKEPKMMRMNASPKLRPLKGAEGKELKTTT